MRGGSNFKIYLLTDRHWWSTVCYSIYFGFTIFDIWYKTFMALTSCIFLLTSQLCVLFGWARTPPMTRLWNLHLLIQSLQRLQKQLRCHGHVGEHWDRLIFHSHTNRDETWQNDGLSLSIPHFIIHCCWLNCVQSSVPKSEMAWFWGQVKGGSEDTFNFSPEVQLLKGSPVF